MKKLLLVVLTLLMLLSIIPALAENSGTITLTLLDFDGSTFYTNNYNKNSEVSCSVFCKELADYNNTLRSQDTATMKLASGWYLDANNNGKCDAGEEYHMFHSDYETYSYSVYDQRSVMLEDDLTLRAIPADVVAIELYVDDSPVRTDYYMVGEKLELTAKVDVDDDTSYYIDYWTIGDDDSTQYAVGTSFIVKEDTKLVGHAAEEGKEIPSVRVDSATTLVADSTNPAKIQLTLYNADAYVWQVKEIGKSADAEWEPINSQNTEPVKINKDTDGTVTTISLNVYAGSGDMDEANYYIGVNNCYFRLIAYNMGDDSDPENCPVAYSSIITVSYVSDSTEIEGLEARFADSTTSKAVEAGKDFELEGYATQDGDLTCNSGFTWYESADNGATWKQIAEDASNKLTTQIETQGTTKQYYFEVGMNIDGSPVTATSPVMTVTAYPATKVNSVTVSPSSVQSGEKVVIKIDAENVSEYSWSYRMKEEYGWTTPDCHVSSTLNFVAPVVTEETEFYFNCMVKNAYTGLEDYLIGNYTQTHAVLTVSPKTTTDETGALSISIGEVTGENVPADVSVNLKITLTKDGSHVSGTFGDVVFNENGEGNLTVTLSSSEEGISTQTAIQSITGIPVGTNYSIESLNSEYSITDGATGTIGADGATVSLKLNYAPVQASSANDEMVPDAEIQNESSAPRQIDVTGKLLDNNDVNEPKIYSVELVWGNMEFQYEKTEYIQHTWNAQDHTYTDSNYADDKYEWKLLSTDALTLPDGMNGVVANADQSYVIVFNHSNDPVEVEMSNTSSNVGTINAALNDVLGVSAKDGATGVKREYALAKGVESTRYDASTGTAAKITVDGAPTEDANLSEDAENMTTIASLKVTISKPE